MRIRRTTAVLQRLPEAFDGARIAHFTDVHLGRPCPRDRLLGALASVRADWLVFTGDLIHHRDDAETGVAFVEALCDVIDPSTEIYGVFGNHDVGLPQALAGRGGRVVWLNHRIVRLRRGGQTVQLAGLSQLCWEDTDLPATFGDWRADETTIVLAHFPATAALLIGAADLVLSGHSHGGQVRLPGLPFFTNDFLPSRYACGQVRLGGTQMVVSSGCGYSGPMNLRLFAAAEVGLITLRCG